MNFEEIKANAREIELKGDGAKRTFRGHALYWEKDDRYEFGVFLTEDGYVAAWQYVPGAKHRNRAEHFVVVEGLEDYFGMNEERWQGPEARATAKKIQDEYIRLTGRQPFNVLDI